MLISGKGKCFHGVWLHFIKFSGKYFLVFGKEEGKHKSRKTQATTQEKIINDDTEHRPTTAPLIAISLSSRDRDFREFASSIAISIRCARSRSMVRSRSSRDRAVDRDLDLVQSREGEIAINGVVRSQTGDRDQRRRGIADWRSQTGDCDQRWRDHRLEIAISRTRSLSLSFSGNTLKGK